MKTYIIKTFGCAQNESDSERLAAAFEDRGMVKAQDLYSADHVIINSCMVRETAENRVYGLVNNLGKNKLKNGSPQKITVTGCMVGMCVRDKSGKFLSLIKKRMPYVDEFLPIEEVGFDHLALRADTTSAWIPISNGCNNFCTFCVVPFSRGREISRPYNDILEECRFLVSGGFTKITLLGMNVNSYGADLVAGPDNIPQLRDTYKKYFPSQADGPLIQNLNKTKGYKLPNGQNIKPVLVKHLGRLRIPTLFPYLLEDIAKIKGLKKLDFISSNPWDFSDELIKVIASNPNITRSLHIAVQSGSDAVLKRMNRWYTKKLYLNLLEKIRKKVQGVRFSTDIIVGFCGETEDEFHDTVSLARKAQFYKAYISVYSDRPMTAAHKVFRDNIPYQVKKIRWKILEDLINKPNLKKHSSH